MFATHSLDSVVSLLLAAFLSASGVADDGVSPSQEFRPVDTSRLMGTPTTLPAMKVVDAFPGLRFARPVQPTHAGDGSDRLFVVTQPGLIHVFPNKPAVRESRVFLDLRELVQGAGGDNGLFAIAFDPAYRRNGRFYVVYTARSRPKATVVARYRVSATDPNRADHESARELFRIRQPWPDHNAACLAFGPDGYLYIALGDGGYNVGNTNAQDHGTLLGAMLRVDVSSETGAVYSVPPDNPFVGQPGRRPEIWATGLRAPWRFSFDRLQGDCWLGDNGQVQYEEVNLIRRGENYGWMPREGLHRFNPASADARGRPASGLIPDLPDDSRDDDFTDPVLEYPHSQGKSVVGGHVYRGRRHPQLIGAYIYGDYVNGNIWALRWDGQRVSDNRLVARSRLRITSFGEDESGELYLTSFDGRVLRLEPQGENVTTQSFPKRLSETGLFTSTDPLTPHAGLIPYSVNVPLWSDGAAKERYIALPRAHTIGFRTEGAWEFPVGAVLIKTFALPDTRQLGARQRLETRLLVRNPRGWDGYTYRWQEDQTDAVLLAGAVRESLHPRSAMPSEWYFPGPSDCRECHTHRAGDVLGLTTAQLNRDELAGDGTRSNQLRRLADAQVFTGGLSESIDELPAFPSWEAGSGKLSERARAYLHVNCAPCHWPPGYTAIDLRADTPLTQAGLLRCPPEKPRVGPGDSLLISPGAPERSELLLRLGRRGPAQMPNLATSVVDAQAVQVIADWIRAMPRDD